MHRIIVRLFAAALCVVATPALASPSAQGGTQITAFVPEVCDLSANSFVLTESGRLTGVVQEFCNTSTAYQVFATHRPLGLDEIATVRYGARTTSLDNSGLATVAFRSGQRLENVPVEIDAQELSAPLAVAFTMSAI